MLESPECNYFYLFSYTIRQKKENRFYSLDKEHIVMQSGRMSENEFSCDFRYPLSLMQAFGIALSAFDSRLFRD